MKRSFAGLTTAAAAAALLALPAAGFAQAPADRPTATEAQEQASPTPATPQPRPETQDTPQAEQPATAQAPAAQSQVDTGAVKQHLTAARNALAEMTQLPAAAQLAGDARTQVSQLIANFNELISAKTNWRAAYDKVEGNLDALLGEQAGEAPATAGTPGAVGTSGSTALDASVRAKLLEVQNHLGEFEKAASGGSTTGTMSDPAGTAPAASPSPATSASPTATPSPAATPSPSATGAAETSPAAGAEPASPAEAETAAAAAGGQSTTQRAAEGHSDAMRHIDAIEAILNGQQPGAAAGATAGTSGSASAGTLDQAKVDEIKRHLSELRRALSR